MMKIALVTGGNRGIGKEIGFQLASKGIKVILTTRDLKKGKEAKKWFEELHLTVDFMKLDVTSDESIEALVDQLYEQYDHLDILVNNAGISLGPNTTLKVSRADMQKTLNTNFFGPLLLSQKLVPLLKKSDNGKIINISSGMGTLNQPGPGYAAYRISKTALNGLTAFMAQDLKSSGVKVYGVCPGWVQTDMGGKNAPLPISEGADTPLWLALNDDAPTGKLFRKRKVIPW